MFFDVFFNSSIYGRLHFGRACNLTLVEIVPLSLRPSHRVTTAENVVSLTMVHNIPGTRDIFRRSVFEIRSHRRPDLSRNYFTMDFTRFSTEPFSRRRPRVMFD